jgi:hypothetical protein
MNRNLRVIKGKDASEGPEAQKRDPENAMPPKECELLYYGTLFDDDEIVFLPKELVDDNIKAHQAMNQACTEGLTWGHVINRYPELWTMLEELDLPYFGDWLEEQEQSTTKNEKLHVLTSPKTQYMNLSKWDRMPLPEEPFDPQVIIEHYPSLEAPHSGSGAYIPWEIRDEYGTEQNGFFIDAYVTFQKKGLRKVIHALGRHGFICRRDQSKIDAARGL